MDTLIALAVIGLMISIAVSFTNREPAVTSKSTYQYKAKDHIMTKTEEKFFRLLSDTVSEKYLVFPQIHLSAILDHKIKNGQNWKGAFSHINSKSVDFVLCDKLTLKPIYAIELDDSTHQLDSRIARDKRVEEIFKNAAMPLVRFSGQNSITSQDIIQKLTEARQTTI